MEPNEALVARGALLGLDHRPDTLTAGIDYFESETEFDPVSTVTALVRQRFAGQGGITTSEPAAFSVDVHMFVSHVTLNYDAVLTSAVFSTLNTVIVRYVQQMTPMLVLVDHGTATIAASAFAAYFERHFKSPFRQIKEVRERHLQAIIESVGVAYRVPYAEALRARLRELQTYWADEHTTEEHLSTDALAGLLTFLSAHPALKLPEIFTADDGTWVAQWRHDADHVLSVHFIDATMARYSVLAREPRAKPGEAQGWGSIETSRVLALAKAHGADKWMTREG